LIIFGLNIFWNDYQNYSKTKLFGLFATAVFWLMPSLIYSLFSLVIIAFFNFKFDKNKTKFLFVFELILLLPNYILISDNFTYKEGVYDLN
jgi:ABC-type phosphate transport system permease subunit